MNYVVFIVLILFSSTSSSDDVFKLESIKPINSSFCYGGFDFVYDKFFLKKGNLHPTQKKYYSHVAEKYNKSKLSYILTHFFNNVTFANFSVKKAVYEWPNEHADDDDEYFTVSFFLKTTLKSYLKKLRDNKIYEEKYKIDNHVVYTVNEDYFLLKEENGYLKITCLGPG